MATFRVGVGSFNIEDSGVGFGTSPTDGLGNLKVKGVTKTTGSIVSGASTLTRYSGFAADNINQLENITLTSEVGTIGDIVVGVGTSVIISSASTVTVGTVESVSIGTHFSPPKGGIEDRGDNFTEGMMRFNTDLNTMEFYNGNEWKQFTYISDIQNSPSSRGRAIFFGGYHQPSFPSGYNGLTVDFFNMTSGGLSQNFGEYTASRRTNTSGSGNATRGLSANAYNGPGQISNSNSIEYVTIASSGDVIDFGDRTAAGYGGQAVSSSTRGVFLGVRDTPGDKTVIDYIEISTIGNAIDFGDLIANGGYKAGNLNSPIRGFVAGGQGPLGTKSNDIQMITIASKGNAIRTGDIPRITDNSTGASNSVRGIISGGYSPTSPTAVNAVIADLYFLNLASQGDAFSFGDLTASRQRCGGTANATRAIFAGGFSHPGSVVVSDSIDNVTISTTGSAVDFGTLSGGKHQFGATSDSHGGLGGY